MHLQALGLHGVAGLRCKSTCSALTYQAVRSNSTMTSVLAQQLQQLAEARGDATARRVRGKPSLLFDYQKAADVDLQTIYTIALQGDFRLPIAMLSLRMITSISLSRIRRRSWLSSTISL